MPHPFVMVSVSCLAACFVACAAASPAGRASATAAVTPAANGATSEAVAREATVAVHVRAPLRARHDRSLAAKPSLEVVVTNRSAQVLDVSELELQLETSREGVALRCASEVRPPLDNTEPTTLAPGATFVFDRPLDCALPLVGAYSLRVAVSFGAGAFRTSRHVRAFNLTVTALPNVGPSEVVGMPGLWAAMGSTSTLPGGTGQEHGRTLLTLVNSTDRPIELPRMQLSLRVYRLGNPIACEDAPLVLKTPAVLAPSDAYSEPIEISCVGLADPGTYDIAARLVVPRGSEGDLEVALGRFRVEVVGDPALRIAPTGE